MKKVLKFILIFLIIFVISIFIFYKVDRINRRKKVIAENANYLIKSISNLNYETIKQYSKGVSGNDLTNDEISNFLINTGLYRISLLDSIDNERNNYTCSTNINFFNINEGTITINITALNGDIITNTFKYINNGTHEYFVFDEIEEPIKEKSNYLITNDLLNGSNIEYSDNITTSKDTLKFCSMKKNADNTISFEIIKEAISDYKISLINNLNKLSNSLKDINGNYNITWNLNFSEFNIYYEESVKSKVIYYEMYLKILKSSIILQTLNDNNDWHLKINYYNYDTNELLSSQTIR